MKQKLKKALNWLAANIPTRYRNAGINILLQDADIRTLRQNADVNTLLRNELGSVIRQLNRENLMISNVYDIGAHKGSWTTDLSRSFPDMKFFMFEANSIHEENLRNTGNWYNLGILSDFEREVDFYSNDGTGDSYYRENTSIYDNVAAKKLRGRTLDGVVEESRIPFPDFLKIDTQGSELDILRGGKKCLSYSKAILIECPIYPYNVSSPELSDYVNFMLSEGFYPSHCTELHKLEGVFVQIDIIFIKSGIMQKINKNFGKFYNLD